MTVTTITPPKIEFTCAYCGAKCQGELEDFRKYWTARWLVACSWCGKTSLVSPDVLLIRDGWSDAELAFRTRPPASQKFEWDAAPDDTCPLEHNAPVPKSCTGRRHGKTSELRRCAEKPDHNPWRPAISVIGDHGELGEWLWDYYARYMGQEYALVGYAIDGADRGRATITAHNGCKFFYPFHGVELRKKVST